MDERLADGSRFVRVISLDDFNMGGWVWMND